MSRTARIERETKESKVLVELDLDGTGRADVSTGVGFYDHMLTALSRLGASADEAIFIGDSPHDIAAGREAGTRTAGVLWGPFERSVLEAESPTHLFDHPADILRLLDGDTIRATTREGAAIGVVRAGGDATG